jgi:hypothetical protein
MIAIPQLRMAKLLSFMDDAAKPGGFDLMMYRARSALLGSASCLLSGGPWPLDLCRRNFEATFVPPMPTLAF